MDSEAGLCVGLLGGLLWCCPIHGSESSEVCLEDSDSSGRTRCSISQKNWPAGERLGGPVLPCTGVVAEPTISSSWIQLAFGENTSK